METRTRNGTNGDVWTDSIYSVGIVLLAEVSWEDRWDEVYTSQPVVTEWSNDN